MPVKAVLGGQWGDEGKGKIVDLIAGDYRHIVRPQGGNNAGHTLVIGGKEHKLHLIPSGIFHNNTLCYIGAGTVVDVEVLGKEIESLTDAGISLAGRLFLSPFAHLILPQHRHLDARREEQSDNAIGTTKRGIGPCYSDKALRIGLRAKDLTDAKKLKKKLISLLEETNEACEQLYHCASLVIDDTASRFLNAAALVQPFVNDVEGMLLSANKKGEPILLEGAQGALLDINFGTYPFVTSSSTGTAGLLSGSALPPTALNGVLGIFKAFTTRVGAGPFPSEVPPSEWPVSAAQAREIGTTTGRQRRMGWFDAVAARWAIDYNGIDAIALTKLDVLDSFDEIKICVGYRFGQKTTNDMQLWRWADSTPEPIYEIMKGWRRPTQGAHRFEELPRAAQSYVLRLEELCGQPITIVSVGPDRRQTLASRQIPQRDERAIAPSV